MCTASLIKIIFSTSLYLVHASFCPCSVIVRRAANCTDSQAKQGRKFEDLHRNKTQEGKSNAIDLMIGSTIKLNSFDSTDSWGQLQREGFFAIRPHCSGWMASCV